ncbi:hypothetical protein HZS_7006, partial [Henneguya salminicola]
MIEKYFSDSCGVMEFICKKYINFIIIDQITSYISPVSNLKTKIHEKSNIMVAHGQSFHFRILSFKKLSFRPICAALINPFLIALSSPAGFLEVTHNTPISNKIYNKDASNVLKIEPIPLTNYFLTASQNSQICLWTFRDDIVSPALPLLTYIGHSFPVSDIIWGKSDQSNFASCSFDTTVRLWNSDRSSPVRIMAGHLDCVNAINFDEKGVLIASASSDNTCRIFDTRTGNFIRLFNSHTSPVTTVCFSNKDTIISCGLDKKMIVWDIRGGKPVSIFCFPESFSHISYQKDSNSLLTVGFDNIVQLINETDGCCLYTTREDDNCKNDLYNWASLTNKNSITLI